MPARIVMSTLLLSPPLQRVRDSPVFSPNQTPGPTSACWPEPSAAARWDAGQRSRARVHHRPAPAVWVRGSRAGRRCSARVHRPHGRGVQHHRDQARPTVGSDWPSVALRPGQPASVPAMMRLASPVHRGGPCAGCSCRSQLDADGDRHRRRGGRLDGRCRGDRSRSLEPPAGAHQSRNPSDPAACRRCSRLVPVTGG